jgi:hypothetical protein
MINSKRVTHFAILFIGVSLIVLIMSAGAAVANALNPVILK